MCFAHIAAALRAEQLLRMFINVKADSKEHKKGRSEQGGLFYVCEEAELISAQCFFQAADCFL